MKYRIKEHRKRRGWTLDQLADVVGTSKGYLSDLERGNRTGGVEMLQAIAQALGVSQTDLFLAEDENDQKVLDHAALYRLLSPEDRDAVDRIVRGLLPERDG